MLLKACHILLYGRAKHERRKGPAMQSPKSVNPSSVPKPSTTRDELKLVCRKIADMDALWRINDTDEAPPLKRAA